jgi:hypothetical protein
VIESNVELRQLLADETTERLGDSASRRSAIPGRLRRRLGRLFVALGTRLAPEPARPPAPDFQRAGDSPGALGSVPS